MTVHRRTFLVAAIMTLAVAVDGPVRVTGTTGEVGIEAARVDGPVNLADNAGPLVSASKIGGRLTCSGNDPAPTDNGLPNTVSGPSTDQCGAL